MTPIGARIKEVRVYLGLTQAAFSQKVCGGKGFPTAIQLYELGSSIPGGNVLQKITNLGVDGHWLLTGEGQIMRANREEPAPMETPSLYDLKCGQDRIIGILENVFRVGGER